MAVESTKTASTSQRKRAASGASSEPSSGMGITGTRWWPPRRPLPAWCWAWEVFDNDAAGFLRAAAERGLAIAHEDHRAGIDHQQFDDLVFGVFHHQARLFAQTVHLLEAAR